MMRYSFKYGAENIISDKNEKITIDCIEVTPVKNEYPEYNATEWVLYFENTSDRNSEILSEINDCDILLDVDNIANLRPGYKPESNYPRVTSMKGCVEGYNYQDNDVISATEYNTFDEFLTPGKIRAYKNLTGRSSDGTMPFFRISAEGSGAMIAIGWTGGWKAEFSNVDNEKISIKTGLQNAEFYLEPGEKIRTTSVLVMKYSDDEDCENKFRRLIKNHFSHTACTPAVRSGLLATELWGGLTSDEMIKRLNELKDYGIGFEDVWIDAGWYGKCKKCDEAFSGDWWSYTGDWECNPRVHPDELQNVRKAAEAAGMNLMLWFEPERATEHSEFYKNHPDWLLEKSFLYYGNDDAKEYVKKVISGYVEKLNLSCYRQDFNTDLDRFMLRNDEENRKGISEIKHITGMYEVWDYLLEKHPGLIIDNCSSGGRRIDIETLKRSIPFFRSDYQCEFNENAEVLQVHNSNISRYLPYNGCTTKTKCDMYNIRSSFSSSWGGAFYNAIFQSMSDEDFKWAKKALDEYHMLRPYFDKDFYNHASTVFDTTAWTVWQYHDTDTDSGIVMAFRRENSPFDTLKISLKGVNKSSYMFENLDGGLKFEGVSELEIKLPEKRSCTVFMYK